MYGYIKCFFQQSYHTMVWSWIKYDFSWFKMCWYSFEKTYE